MVYPVLTNEEMTTESQRYNCFTRDRGKAIPKHAGPEAKVRNPTTGLTLLWARNTFRGNFNLLTPNVNYSGRTAPLTSKVAFYIFIQQI